MGEVILEMLWVWDDYFKYLVIRVSAFYYWQGTSESLADFMVYSSEIMSGKLKSKDHDTQ